MYVSPLTERMRKRKAFADTQLESSGHLLTMPTFSAHSTPSITNLSLSYSRLSIPNSSPTSHFNNFVDLNPCEQQQQQQQITLNENTCDYLPSSIMTQNYQQHEYLNTERLPAKIRIIDEAKLYNISAQHMNNESFAHAKSSINDNNHCNAKPKLSFSIESIIGIK